MNFRRFNILRRERKKERKPRYNPRLGAGAVITSNNPQNTSGRRALLQGLSQDPFFFGCRPYHPGGEV